MRVRVLVVGRPTAARLGEYEAPESTPREHATRDLVFSAGAPSTLGYFSAPAETEKRRRRFAPERMSDSDAELEAELEAELTARMAPRTEAPSLLLTMLPEALLMHVLRHLPYSVRARARPPHPRACTHAHEHWPLAALH